MEDAFYSSSLSLQRLFLELLYEYKCVTSDCSKIYYPFLSKEMWTFLNNILLYVTPFTPLEASALHLAEKLTSPSFAIELSPLLSGRIDREFNTIIQYPTNRISYMSPRTTLIVLIYSRVYARRGINEDRRFLLAKLLVCSANTTGRAKSCNDENKEKEPFKEIEGEELSTEKYFCDSLTRISYITKIERKLFSKEHHKALHDYVWESLGLLAEDGIKKAHNFLSKVSKDDFKAWLMRRVNYRVSKKLSRKKWVLSVFDKHKESGEIGEDGPSYASIIRNSFFNTVSQDLLLSYANSEKLREYKEKTHPSDITYNPYTKYQETDGPSSRTTQEYKKTFCSSPVHNNLYNYSVNIPNNRGENLLLSSSLTFHSLCTLLCLLSKPFFIDYYALMIKDEVFKNVSPLFKDVERVGKLFTEIIKDIDEEEKKESLINKEKEKGNKKDTEENTLEKKIYNYDEKLMLIMSFDEEFDLFFKFTKKFVKSYVFMNFSYSKFYYECIEFLISSIFAPFKMYITVNSENEKSPFLPSRTLASLTENMPVDDYKEDNTLVLDRSSFVSRSMFLFSELSRTNAWKTIHNAFISTMKSKDSLNVLIIINVSIRVIAHALAGVSFTNKNRKKDVKKSSSFSCKRVIVSPFDMGSIFEFSSTLINGHISVASHDGNKSVTASIIGFIFFVVKFALDNRPNVEGKRHTFTASEIISNVLQYEDLKEIILMFHVNNEVLHCFATNFLRDVVTRKRITFILKFFDCL